MRLPAMLMPGLYREPCARRGDGTIRRMRTLLIAGSNPVPPRLREIIDRGSTSVREQRSAGPSASVSTDFDRVVFWAASDDEGLRELAGEYARQEAAGRREIVVFVTPESAAATIAGLEANEMYVWPRDEDRLEVAFLTGA